MVDPGQWAVVIANYNRPTDTITCLESLDAAAPTAGRVFLVDDGSIDDSLVRVGDWARQRGIGITLTSAEHLQGDSLRGGEWLVAIRTPANLGFTLANNIALRYVRDHTEISHVLLLNNDAAVAPDFFGVLAAAVANHSDAGLATGTIYEWDRRTVWYAGGSVNPVRALVRHALVPPRNGEPQPTDFVCGCAMLISRSVLDQVGLLPECYAPFYGEDADYSLRVRAAGFKALYVPRATVYHRVGANLGRTERTPLVTFCLNRHRAFMVRRNFSGWKRAAGLTYMALTKPGRAVIELLRGRPASAWAVLSGTASGLLSRAARSA